ncbi:type II secretion system protein [Oxynema sp. CENA135]|uniref:type II secretion system protein n=1 Tax=Oxynema sp. CENA135 TaxID=984206 RepID=UPI00190A62FC|nr:type II secretion system protein [Oxynema sp. CENA135]
MRRSKPTKFSEQGLTLVESLAAIVIFGIAITAITPPLMLAMAARVKAYRVEQAMQLAEGEIDRVRLVVDRDFTEADYLSTIPPSADSEEPKDVAVPTGSVSCSDTDPPSLISKAPPDAETACNIDIDGDEKIDFVVQTFRTNDYSPDGGDPLAFRMGVRVYTKASLDSGQTLQTEPISLAFSAITTSGPSPLAVMYAPIVRSDIPNAAEAYNEILKE